VRSRVGDARAGGRDLGDLDSTGVALGELGGHGLGGGGGALKELEAEALAKLLEPVVDQVAVAAVVCALRPLGGGSQAHGHGHDEGSLHDLRFCCR
jgi:hypothetical protein